MEKYVAMEMELQSPVTSHPRLTICRDDKTGRYSFIIVGAYSSTII